MANAFLNKVENENNLTTTENGAIAFASTGSILIDQFGKISSYLHRDYKLIFQDQDELWKENPLNALKFIFYMRMITRKTVISDKWATTEVQMGQGMKHESMVRLLWIAKNHWKIFAKNIIYLPIVGSWKDLFTLIELDKTYNLTIFSTKKRRVIYFCIQAGMACPQQFELIRKFMPRHKHPSKLTTEHTKIMNMIAEELIMFFGITPKEYNKLKSEGTAHEFQKIICGRKYDQINWNLIPSKALNLLVNSKFLYNHNLCDNYLEWLDKQPTVKFNGFAYDLLMSLKPYLTWNTIFDPRKKDDSTFTYRKILPKHIEHTINKQFKHLLERAKADRKITENVWCAIDTSGSMSALVDPKKSNLSVLDIAISLGIFFSSLNEGAFKNHVIMFESDGRALKLNGEFSDMVTQFPSNAMGGTNFLSAVEEIVRIRKENPTIPLEDYPTTLLVVSDMQFNPVRRIYLRDSIKEKNNHEAAVDLLKDAFPKEFVEKFKFVWWNVNGIHNNYPSKIDDGGTYLFSGFDGSVVSLLLGEETKENSKEKPKNMEDIVKTVLNQEILTQLTV